MLLLSVAFSHVLLINPIQRAPVHRCTTSMCSQSPISSELATLAAVSDKTAQENARILELSKNLASVSDERYLDSPALLGNYELLYYDRSVDGGRDIHESSITPPRKKSGGLQRFLRRLMFRQRGTFQHIVASDRLVNFQSFRLLGIPARIVSEGTFSRLAEGEIEEIRQTNGTSLTSETVRVVFSPPRVGLGWLCFEFGDAGAPPPVVLCTTYLDTESESEGLRLGLAAGGGRFVFARGGKAAEPFADEWRAVSEMSPTDARLLFGGVSATVAISIFRPMLLAQILYAGGGLALGFGSTKFLRFASSGAATARVGALLGSIGAFYQRHVNLRSRLRAALLEMDPSLAENEGETIGFRDLRGPLGRKRGGGMGPFGGPPKPPWKKG